jgi:hypothetical protein
MEQATPPKLLDRAIHPLNLTFRQSRAILHLRKMVIGTITNNSSAAEK